MMTSDFNLFESLKGGKLKYTPVIKVKSRLEKEISHKRRSIVIGCVLMLRFQKLRIPI